MYIRVSLKGKADADGRQSCLFASAVQLGLTLCRRCYREVHGGRVPAVCSDVLCLIEDIQGSVAAEDVKMRQPLEKGSNLSLIGGVNLHVACS